MLSRLLLLLLPLLIISCHNRRIKPVSKANTSVEMVISDVSYQDVVANIDSLRLLLQKEYTSGSYQVKATVLSYSKKALVRSIGTDLFNFWEGTPWDYNGTTVIPNQGKIACGYFVTTLLKDAGVQLDRQKLAVCASFTMMKTLTSQQSVKNLSSMSYAEFTNYTGQFGNAVFVVGLDFHTGFIVNVKGQSWFIHSNYINRVGVMKERVEESLALQASKTRYITCLTENKKFLLNWLLH
jgi:hypothetical protein